MGRTLRRMCVVAGLSIFAVAAQAFLFDGQITIDRALNSPTLTVRYVNANAALVELRVNGESVATRAVNSGKNTGETTFNLDLTSLKGGDNKVEIRLFDKTGNLLASQDTTITTESSQGPVFINSPKMGATVRGNVDIQVGFSQTLKNSYVSFFVDNEFKAISNVPPFEFNWDTTRDDNGWHEVEAWVVDDSISTFKTRKVRVFVNNPGGHTPRTFTATKPVAPPPAVAPKADPAPPKVSPKAQPATVALEAMSFSPHLSVGGNTSTKPAKLQTSVSAGLKEMIPTGTRLAPKPLAVNVQKSLPPSAVLHTAPAAAATGSISITKGQHLPNIGTFAIVYNTQFVNFDVQPRVSDGVPLTPLRYLIEKAGGKVDWAGATKDVSARADGHDIFLHIGDSFAEINKQRISLERPSFLESGRAIVPLSFMRDALNVNIDYDRETGHVLITSIKK